MKHLYILLSIVILFTLVGCKPTQQQTPESPIDTAATSGDAVVDANLRPDDIKTEELPIAPTDLPPPPPEDPIIKPTSDEFPPVEPEPPRDLSKRSPLPPEEIREIPVAPVATDSNTSEYIPYSQEALNELKGQRPFVLFFHASWCPTCRRLDGNLNSKSDELDSAVILKANYDSESELKKEYKVTVQHTLVFFNADGTIAKKKIGTLFDEVKEFFR